MKSGVKLIKYYNELSDKHFSEFNFNVVSCNNVIYTGVNYIELC